MDVNEYYTELASALKFPSEKRERIDASVEFFMQKIWGAFRERLQEVIVFGSYSRDTIICKDEESDVDIVAIYKTREVAPDTYLKQIRDFCEEVYTRTKIYQDHPTIVVDMEHIKFEIVPSYYVSTGTVKIPAPKSKELRWITTNPGELITRVERKNKANRNLILPVIRILKYWNSLNARPFPSFQIEKIIIDTLYNCSTLREYLSYAVSALGDNARGESQNKLVAELKSKMKGLYILEKNNFHRYLEPELNSFLPLP